MAPLDGAEWMARRLRQQVYLSHYGSDPIGSWEHRTTWELEDAFAAMNRLIRLENGETGVE